MVPSPLRFAIQGDVHGFRRIPKEILELFLKDSAEYGCSFFCLLGDSCDGGPPIFMSLSRSSSIALFYQYGDHEFFGEWSIGGCSKTYPKKRIVGEDKDPLIMAMGGIPRCEAWSGLPRFWSMTYRGIHFVFAFNGKHEVWTPWFLAWLRNDLKENSGFTTVILSHRGLEEDVGIQGSSVEALRRMLKAFPQVVLFCSAHVHGWGLRLMDGLTEVKGDTGEANWREGWYVVVEIRESSLRILHRNAVRKESVLRFHRPLRTTLSELHGNTVRVAFPFIVPDGGTVYNPALWLSNARIRVWGVKGQQLMEDPFFSRGLRWRGLNGAKVDLIKGDPLFLKMLGITRVARIRIRSIYGTEKHPVKVCHIASLPISFNQASSGESGSYTGGTVYDVLLISRIPEGRKLRLLLETYTSEGKLESVHFVDGIGGEGLTAILAKVGMIFIPGLPFRWIGVNGKSEVDGLPMARSATRLEVYLAVPEHVEEAEYLAIAFIYPHEGFYMPIEFGVHITRDTVICVGVKTFNLGNISESAFKEIKLGEMAGGEKITLRCSGSRLAIVELLGEAYGFMQHVIRRVRRIDETSFKLAEPNELGEALLRLKEFNRHVGITALTVFGRALINKRLAEPLQNIMLPPREQASVRFL